MNKLPVISGRQLVKALRRIRFELDRRKGSHMMLYRADPPTTLSIPDHRELTVVHSGPCCAMRA